MPPAPLSLGSAAWQALVVDGARSLGIRVTPDQAAACAVHAAELIRWNRKVNLTRILAPREVAVKHFVDALAVLPFVPPGARVLDIGAGGGFPGIPLKVCRPAIDITLIDAVHKKVVFMNHVIRCLGVSGATARHVRAEALAAPGAGEPGYDVIVCRALTELAAFHRMARPLLNPGGRMIAMKGRLDPAERDAVTGGRHTERTARPADAAELPPRSATVIRYRLPLLDAERTLVAIAGDFPGPFEPADA